MLLGLTDEGPADWTPPSVRAPAGGGPLRARARRGPRVARPLPPGARHRPSPAPTTPTSASRGRARSPSRPAKRAARARAVGVTAMLLAAVTGGLHAVLAARGELTPALVVRAMVPLSVRDAAEGGALGNRYASVFVGLPVGVASRTRGSPRWAAAWEGDLRGRALGRPRARPHRRARRGLR